MTVAKFKAYVYQQSSSWTILDRWSHPVEFEQNTLFLVKLTPTLSDVYFPNTEQSVRIPTPKLKEFLIRCNLLPEANIQRLLGNRNPSNIPTSPPILDLNIAILKRIAKQDQTTKLASGLAGWMNFNNPENGYHRRGAVYICYLYDLYKKTVDSPMSLDIFKRGLLLAHVKGEIQLSRADLVQPQAVPYITKSAIISGVSEWNLYNIE